MVTTYPKLVLHQVNGVLMQLVKKGSCLLFTHMFEYPLKNPAAIRVCGQLIDTAFEGLDKAKTLRRYALKEFLDDLK